MRLARTVPALGGVLIVALGLTAGMPPASGSSSLPTNCAGDRTTISCTFRYNGTTGSDGTPQSFTVPAGVRRLVIEAWGAQGGTVTEDSGPFDPPIVGGLGGYAAGTVALRSGAVLSINVGGQPTGTGG